MVAASSRSIRSSNSQPQNVKQAIQMASIDSLHPNTIKHDNHNPWLVAAISPLMLALFWHALQTYTSLPKIGLCGLTLLLLMATTTITDLRQRKIYNWTTYTACAWAIAINFLPSPLSLGTIGLSPSLIGMLVCFTVMLIPYTLARGGAGDVKLAAAIGCLVGATDGLTIIAVAYIVAAISLCGWSVWNQGPLNLAAALFRTLVSGWIPQYVSAPTSSQKRLLQKPIPLAGFFAIAVLIVQLDVPEFIRSL